MQHYVKNITFQYLRNTNHLLSAPLQHHQEQTNILVLVEERVLVATRNIFTLKNYQKTERHQKNCGQGEGFG